MESFPAIPQNFDNENERKHSFEHASGEENLEISCIGYSESFWAYVFDFLFCTA